MQHHGDDGEATAANHADDPTTPADGAPEGGATQPAPVAGDVPAVPDVPAPVAVEVTPPTAAQAPVADVPVQPQEAQPALPAQPELAAAATPVAAPQQASAQQQVAAAAPETTQADVAVKPDQQKAAADTGVVAVSTDEAAPAAPQADAKPDARPAPPAAVAAVKPKEAPSEPGQQQQREPGTLPQPAAEQARTVAQAYGRAQNTTTEVPTTAQSGAPAASPATPVAGGQPAAARGEFAPASQVPLSRAAENVEHVLRLAANRGVTHARIALNPASLGSIDVHLRHTRDGVVAHIVAHAPEAVQQLQQAAANLRSQLEGQGVNLLSLDIGQSAGEERSAGRAGAGFGDEDRGDRRGQADGGDAAGVEPETTVNSTLQLPNGVLVDVLA